MGKNAFFSPSRIDAWIEQKFSRDAHMTDYTVQFLLMELESVGNIRLEEGCPADRWCRAVLFNRQDICIHMSSHLMGVVVVATSSNRFTSCCDLLLSRFHPSDFEAHGVSGVNVSRVVRVNNSALRLRFEDRFDSLRVGNDGSAQ